MSNKEPIIYKELRLITPEYAQRLGIAAEAPVFISPQIVEGICVNCGVTITPLVYAFGREVIAQHFCLNNGGIYVYRRWNNRASAWSVWMGVGIATGSYIGRNYFGSEGGRYKSILLSALQVKCAECRERMVGDIDLWHKRTDAISPMHAECKIMRPIVPSKWQLHLTESGEPLFMLREEVGIA